MNRDANLDLAEVSRGILQPDVILPSQHFRPQGKITPEHRLMIAVLDEAIQCLEKYRFATKRRGQRLFREVTEWMLAEEMSWPYSFPSICAVLDLDANAVRQRLRVAPPRQLDAAARAQSATAPVK